MSRKAALVLAAWVATASGFASTAFAGESEASHRRLRDASVESAPRVLEAPGRFRLRARLHPAPVSTRGTATHAFALSSRFSPKAGLATCPLPGAIFYDGFE